MFGILFDYFYHGTSWKNMVFVAYFLFPVVKLLQKQILVLEDNLEV